MENFESSAQKFFVFLTQQNHLMLVDRKVIIWWWKSWRGTKWRTRGCWT